MSDDHADQAVARTRWRDPRLLLFLLLLVLPLALLRLPTAAAVPDAASAELAATGTLFSSSPAAGSSINFVAVPIGGSVSAVITVDNIGSSPLAISAPAGLSAPFQVDRNEAIEILPESVGIEIRVSCALTSAGSFTATLSYATNDPTLPQVSYALSCTNFDGPTPVYSSDPLPGSEINLGVVPVGSQASATISVSNPGTATLNVSAPGGVVAPFAVVPATAYAVEPAAEAQPVTVSCAPTEPGFFAFTLTYTTNDAERQTIRYSVLCTGVIPDNPAYSSNPVPGAIIDFGNVPVGSSAGVTIAVANQGSATLEVSAPGNLAAPFSVLPTSAYSIAAGADPASVAVTCRPLDVGRFETTLEYTSNDPLRPTISYILRCSGTAVQSSGRSVLPVVMRSLPTLTPTVGPGTPTATTGPQTPTATLLPPTASPGPGTPTITPTTPPLPGQAPDLVIEQLALIPDQRAFFLGESVVISVTVRNQGDAAASPFWVDVSINPSEPPTEANMIWNRYCTLSPCFGLAWYVPNGLGVGESVTLSSRPGDFDALRSRWPGFFALGTTELYAFADSWNNTVPTGGVLEKDETNNRAELFGITVVDTGSRNLVINGAGGR